MLTVPYAGNQGSNTPNASREPSPFLWHDCPWHDILDGRFDGVAIHEDWSGFGGATADYYTKNGHWAAFADTGGTIAASSTIDRALVLTTDAGASDQIGMELGPGTPAGSGIITFTTGVSPKIWFESRFKIGAVGNDYGLFVGLGAAGYSANDGLIPDGCAALTDAKRYVGAAVLGGDGDAIRLVAGGSGAFLAGTAVYADGGSSVAIAADTFVKVGFKVNPLDTAKPVRFYVNGVEVAYLTSTAATVFPATALVPLLIVKDVASSPAAKVFTNAFVRVASQSLT